MTPTESDRLRAAEDAVIQLREALRLALDALKPGATLLDLPGIGTLTIHPHMPPKGGITVYVLDGVLVTKGELRERVAMDNRLDLVLQVK
jgi:hypothetical protein